MIARLDDREAAPITQKPGFLEWLEHPLGSGHAHPTIGTHSFPTHPWGISYVTIKHRPQIAMAGRPASKAAVSKARTPLPLPTVCEVVPGRPVSKACVAKASSRTPLPVATSEGVEVATSEETSEESERQAEDPVLRWSDILFQRLDRLREMQRVRQQMRRLREDEEFRDRRRSRTPSRAAASDVGTPAAASGVDHRSQCQVPPTPSISPSGSGAGTKHAEV